MIHGVFFFLQYDTRERSEKDLSLHITDIVKQIQEIPILRKFVSFVNGQIITQTQAITILRPLHLMQHLQVVNQIEMFHFLKSNLNYYQDYHYPHLSSRILLNVSSQLNYTPTKHLPFHHITIDHRNLDTKLP